MAISRNAGLMINAGDPIAQVVFQRLDEPTVLPYDGKYQDAPPGRQPVISRRVHYDR
ncbi:hypothetical protein [Rhodoligotrophos ferricapiens]|uniref:hypothetical protein n=1 Tax=Rhodoligotrophos ferricapiens TaxID=3069264 RepID=UPI00315CC0B3